MTVKSRQISEIGWLWWTLGMWALALAVTHCVAIYTDAINWDEFGLLHRTDETIRTGVLVGGGRPGLGTLLLLPFVRNCRDIIATAHDARWLTTVATLAFFAGFYSLLKQFLRGLCADPRHNAALGVALLVCVPIVLRWSIQARTDQWALACGLWGGVALLASQRNVYLAWFAGLLFGLSWLFSQKGAYVLGLMGLVSAGRPFLFGKLDLARDAKRALYCLIALALVAGCFRVVTHVIFTPPPPAKPDNWSDYAFFRANAGYGVYCGILFSLGPHIILSSLTVAAFFRFRDTLLRRQLVLAWAVLALGLAIGAFHPSAFAYFWMTLGLFPAIAGALALEPARQLFTSTRLWNVVLSGLWVALLVPTVPVTLAMLRDSQEPQRRALAFVARNFDANAFGFHPEGALACRRDPTPFPVYFSSNIASRFRTDHAVKDFIETFASKPISFIVASYRLVQFPAAITNFWDQHYVLYGPGIWISGFRIVARSETNQHVQVFVPGQYRWHAEPNKARIAVDGTTLSDGDTVTLQTGNHTLRHLDAGATGILALAVDSAPSPAFDFYPPSMIRELDHGL